MYILKIVVKLRGKQESLCKSLPTLNSLINYEKKKNSNKHKKGQKNDSQNNSKPGKASNILSLTEPGQYFLRPSTQSPPQNLQTANTETVKNENVG
jgi:hypothetical protein